MKQFGIYILIILVSQLLLLSCNQRQQQTPSRDDDWIARELKEFGADFSDCRVFSAKADSALAAERNAENYCWKARAHELEGKDKESLADLDSALVLASNDVVMQSYIHSCKARAFFALDETVKECSEYQAIIDLGLDGYTEEAKEALAALPDSLSPDGKKIKKHLWKRGREIR